MDKNVLNKIEKEVNELLDSGDEHAIYTTLVELKQEVYRLKKIATDNK